MRLGVEAALIGGQLVPGDVELAGGEIAAYGLAGSNGRGCIAVPGFVDLQVNGFGGVDFMGADAGRLRPRRRGAARDRRHRVPADLHLRARGGPARGAAATCPFDPPGPRLLGVHLEGPFLVGEAPRRPLAGRPARSRPGAAGAPARGGTGPPDDPRTGAPGRRRADRPAARARDRGLVRALRRDRRRGRTRPSTAARRPSRTSSTRCGPSATATPASSARRSRART